MPPSAMTRDVPFAGGAVGLRDGRDLGHAGAGNHARGADGSRANADLDGVSACVDQGQGALVGGYVAGQQSDMQGSAV